MPPGELEAHEIADRLAASAAEAGLAGYAVVGYSLETALSVRLAARHPQRVRRLVLTAGP